MKTNTKTMNNNEMLVRDSQPAAGLKVKTSLKAGIIRRPTGNHNETLATGRNESPKSDEKAALAAGVKVQTGVKAGEALDDKHKDWVSIFRFSHVGVYFARNLAAGLTTITV